MEYLGCNFSWLWVNCCRCTSEWKVPMSSVHIPRVLTGRNRTAVDTERENFEKAQVWCCVQSGRVRISSVRTVFTLVPVPKCPTGAELSGHFVTSLMGPICLGSDVSWFRSVDTHWGRCFERLSLKVPPIHWPCPLPIHRLLTNDSRAAPPAATTQRPSTPDPVF